MSEGHPHDSVGGSPHGREASGASPELRLYGRNWYWVGFAGLGAAAILIAAIASMSMRSLGRAKDIVLQDYARYVVYSQRAHMLLEKQVASSRGYLLTGDTLYLGRWERTSREAENLLDTLEARAPSDSERALVRDIRLRNREHLAALRSYMAEYPVRRRGDPALTSFRFELQSLRESVDASTSAFVRHGLASLAEAEREARRKSGLALAAVIATTLFTLLLAFLLATRVTRRLAASQRSLLTHQARLDAIVSSAMDAIITIDEAQKVVLFNRAAERIFRLPVWEALGQPLERFIPARFRGKHSRHVERFGQIGVTSRDMGQLGKLSGLRADGEEFPLEATISQTQVAGERLYTVILRDITERIRAEEALKESEARLRQSQKMEAIGQLAGGIAHDFNNLLTAINGYSELTLGMVEEGSPAWENLKEIRKAGGRAATLTSQLLAYSRKQVVSPRILNLNQVVGNIGKMLQRLIGETVTLVTRLEPELDLVKVDAGQVEQMLVNLVLNARDAMPRGGPIEIRTRNAALEPGAPGLVLEAEPGRYVVLEVEDTGTGMTPEVQARIFEPFFTTKSVGKGTGLGLPSVYGIMKQAGGGLQVATTPGKGSTFSLWFPAVAAEARAPASVPGAPDRALRGAGETLLLAEDEPAVRHFTRKTLESNGYRVVSAKDGEEALRLFRDAAGEIRLVVTDIVMPGRTGPELAAALRESRPDLRILFMSGYTEEALDVTELLSRGDHFLAKPFSPDQLLHAVHESLQGRPVARA